VPDGAGPRAGARAGARGGGVGRTRPGEAGGSPARDGGRAAARLSRLRRRRQVRFSRECVRACVCARVRVCACAFVRVRARVCAFVCARLCSAYDVSSSLVLHLAEQYTY
jgi:hypothetical protein